MHRRFLTFSLLVTLLFGLVISTQAQINYTSQPDTVSVFLNGIAYVEDTITLPSNADIQVVLPQGVFTDTLILTQDGDRVPNYRVRNENAQTILQWASQTNADTHVVALTYLMQGISWQPKYDMQIDQTQETVGFDFFAQVNNTSLELEQVNLRLVSGRVDLSQQLGAVSTVTANQVIVGYEQAQQPALGTQAVTIQHIYELGQIDSEPDDVLYTQVVSADLIARRTLVWNASSDEQVTVIYKVRNETTQPFTEGIVRSYEDGVFLGSDFVELTPIGSEGSITVGHLPDVRVSRNETQEAIERPFADVDTRHSVSMSISNFGGDAVTLDVVDFFASYGVNFEFSSQPQREGGNLLRWTMTVESGETTEISYTFDS